MSFAELPHDVISLVGLTIITIGGWGLAWIKDRQHRGTLGAIRDQVQNGHEKPLRVDLDDFRDEMRTGFKDMRRDIGGIREELRDERRERIEGDRRRDLLS